MTVRAQIAHALPGRVRVRLPEQRGDADFFASLAEQLTASGLFQAVSTNPTTGSVVLEFEGPREAVLAKLSAQLPFALDLTGAPPAPPSGIGVAPDPLRLVSGRDVNQMFLIGTLFGVVGLVQTFRGEIMLPALSAFWYAARAFRLSQDPDKASVAAAFDAGEGG
jgi:hypothetical protein